MWQRYAADLYARAAIYHGTIYHEDGRVVTEYPPAGPRADGEEVR